MLVDGLLKVNVEVQPLDALKVIESSLGVTEHFENHSSLVILEPDNKHNRSGKRALYEVIDMSWYGSYHDEYKFVTNNEKDIQCYETLCYIKNLIKENKKLF